MAWFIDGQARRPVSIRSLEIDRRVVPDRVRWCCQQTGTPKELSYVVGAFWANTIYHHLKGRRVPSTLLLYYMSLRVDRPMEWMLGVADGQEDTR